MTLISNLHIVVIFGPQFHPFSLGNKLVKRNGREKVQCLYGSNILKLVTVSKKISYCCIKFSKKVTKIPWSSISSII